MIIDGEVDLTTAKNKLLLNAKNLLKKANYTKLTDDELQNSIGIIAKKIINIFNQHSKYNNTLTTNLYFKSLNNNLGVINYISNNAGEEEVKETILTFSFKL